MMLKVKWSNNWMLKELSEAQQDMVSNLCESIVCSQTKEYWGETLESCVKDFNEIETLHDLKGSFRHFSQAFTRGISCRHLTP